MARESVHSKLSRVRKPRVHITYDVQVGSSIEDKQLPFVVGVLADLSGQPKQPLARVKDRKFVEIDRDNFNDVLKGTAPRVTFRVPNRLAKDGSELGVDLEFSSMEDFAPATVAKQVEPIRKLVKARERLNELALKINANERLDELLQDVLKNTDSLKQLREAGHGGDVDPSSGTEGKE